MSMNTRIPNRPDDHVDRLYADYFRAQLPARWPNPPTPWADPARPATAASGDPASKSRWALAASVALLIGTCWYLSGHISDGKRKPGFDPEGGAANSKLLKEFGKDKPKAP